jgi:membrane protease YdiL (CAAX protease family)
MCSQQTLAYAAKTGNRKGQSERRCVKMMSRLSNLVKQHPLITFFVLTYVITWGGIPFMGFNAGGPFIAALIAIPLTQGLAGLKELGLRIIRWRVRWYWYAVALSLPLAVHLLNVGLSVTAGMGIPPQHFTSLTGLLMYFALRLVNPADGPVGEEPGWRGFALPGLQSTLSPLASTAILAVLITIWHLPLFFFAGDLPPSVIVGGILGPITFTFVATWLFNRTGGSVLLTIIMHAAEGSINAEGWIYAGLWVAVAIGLVIFDRKAWRAPAPSGATTPPVMPPRGATPVAPWL